RNSRIRGPVIIGSGTEIVDSYVGPFTAIASDCRIESSDIEQSVVLDRSRIVGVARLSDSLIGRDAEIHRSGLRPASTRLMIGDHCSIDLE
ncbi:MAG TPA: glucose-1-phosphate thymidylyltransferase, partial [Microthrixaceae bacterium]|nr:glucose-1-phosphate thymidylyltransferase [Microthrixaceae bacterium]